MDPLTGSHEARSVALWAKLKETSLHIERRFTFTDFEPAGLIHLDWEAATLGGKVGSGVDCSASSRTPLLSFPCLKLVQAQLLVSVLSKARSVTTST